MSSKDAPVGMRLRDRAEYKSKPRPLTFPPEASVLEAVQAMAARNYGSVIVVDPDDKVLGVVTERDVMRKLVGAERDAASTTLEEIMTREPRVAQEDDDLLDWLRIMSNERFRRLPVVDADGRIKAVFTQGDFVSYTWPQLMHQGMDMAKAAIGRSYQVLLIVGALMVYTLAMIAVLGAL